MKQPDSPSLNGYAIGSHIRSAVRLYLLLASFALALFLLYWWLSKLTGSPGFVLIVVVVCTVARRAIYRYSREGWIKFITKDAAYGRVSETGIQYRVLLRNHFANWSQIEQIEHLERSGRINVYVAGKKQPVQFAPTKALLPPTCWPGIPDALGDRVHLSNDSFADTVITDTPEIAQSRRDSAIRLATKILVGLALLVALFQLIEHWIGNGTIALFLLVGGLVVAFVHELLFRRIPSWIDFVMRDVRNLRPQ